VKTRHTSTPYGITAYVRRLIRRRPTQDRQRTTVVRRNRALLAHDEAAAGCCDEPRDQAHRRAPGIVVASCRIAVEDREAVKRGISDQHALTDQQFSNLRESYAVVEPARDRGALLDAPHPPIATRPSARRMQREEDLSNVLFVNHRGRADAGNLRGA
jgi:hypothetical protein